MGRRNHRSGRPQARRREDGSTYRPNPSAPPLSTMVLPLGRCEATGLLMFAKDKADQALRQAQATRRAQGSNNIEKRHFHCEACGHRHLTKREGYNA